jgi:hypothetical protein
MKFKVTRAEILPLNRDASATGYSICQVGESAFYERERKFPANIFLPYQVDFVNLNNLKIKMRRYLDVFLAT